MSICSTLKSVNPKSSGGSAPWTPGRGSAPAPPAGALPLHPARGPKAGPWTPPKIVYNIQWCGIIYVCTYTRVTHTGVLWCTYEYMQYSEKRKSKIFRGLRPLDPRQGLCPCTPPGALRRAPGPHPKSACAYALAMCAPRTCLPPPKKNRLALTRSLCALRAHVCPPKKIGSRLRARYTVRSAHMLPKKKRTPAIQKNRLTLRARYVRYAHMFAPP